MITQTRAFMVAKFSTALLWGLLLSSCGVPEPGNRLEPLLDSQHAPDILTEQRIVSLPPALDGNRFLVGWFPWQHESNPVLVHHRECATIHIVNIGADSYTHLTLPTS